MGEVGEVHERSTTVGVVGVRVESASSLTQRKGWGREAAAAGELVVVKSRKTTEGARRLGILA